MTKEFTDEEVRKLDNSLRGKIYINNISKSLYFLHCVLKNIDTKDTNIVLTNTTTDKMMEVRYEQFYEMRPGNDGKLVRRFELYVKPSANIAIKFPVQTTEVMKRINEEPTQGFKPIDVTG